MRISYTLWLFYLIPLLLWIASIRALVRHFVSRIPCIGLLFPFSCCWPKDHAWAQSWGQSPHCGKHFRISVAFFHKQTWGGLGLSVLPLKWGQGTNKWLWRAPLLWCELMDNLVEETACSTNCFLKFNEGLFARKCLARSDRYLCSNNIVIVVTKYHMHNRGVSE